MELSILEGAANGANGMASMQSLGMAGMGMGNMNMNGLGMGPMGMGGYPGGAMNLNMGQLNPHMVHMGQPYNLGMMNNMTNMNMAMGNMANMGMGNLGSQYGVMMGANLVPMALHNGALVHNAGQVMPSVVMQNVVPHQVTHSMPQPSSSSVPSVSSSVSNVHQSSSNNNNNNNNNNNSLMMDGDKSRTTRGRKKGYVPNENKAGKNVLTIAQRLEILSEFMSKKDEKGIRAHLSNKYGISRGRVSQILNNEKDDIHSMVSDPTKFTNVSRMRLSSPKWSEIEHDLYQWILATKAANAANNNSPEINLSFSNIKSKALELAKEKDVPEFTASSGWYSRFMKRVNLAPGVRNPPSLPPKGLENVLDLSGVQNYGHADLTGGVVDANSYVVPNVPYPTSANDSMVQLHHHHHHQMSQQPMYNPHQHMDHAQQLHNQHAQLQHIAQLQMAANAEQIKQYSIHNDDDNSDSDDDAGNIHGMDALKHFNDHKRKAIELGFNHDDTANINMYLSSSIPDATSLASNFANVLDDKSAALAFTDDMRMGGNNKKKVKR